MNVLSKAGYGPKITAAQAERMVQRATANKQVEVALLQARVAQLTKDLATKDEKIDNLLNGFESIIKSCYDQFLRGFHPSQWGRINKERSEILVILAALRE